MPELAIKGPHAVFVLTRSLLFMGPPRRSMAETGVVLVPKGANRFGLLLSRDHDVLEPRALLEERKDRRRELPAGLYLEPAASRELFNLAPIETMHAVAVWLRMKLPHALQALHVLV